MKTRAILLLLSALSVTGCASGWGRRDHQLAERQQQAQLEARIAALDGELAQLRTELDSLRVQNDSLRRGASRLETDLRDREQQIGAIRQELQRLKEIDLKPRRP